MRGAQIVVMNGLDYVMLGVIAVSAVVGLLRGFARETVSLLVWVTAFWLAMNFSDALADHLSGFIHNPSIRLATAFVALFMSILIVGVVANYFLAKLLKKAGVRTSDRVLGVLFGMVRGLLVVALVVVLVGLTPLVESPSWRDSLIVGYLQPLVGHFKFLPGDLQVRVEEWGGSAADDYVFRVTQ